eukprot:g37604.t1
MFRSAPRSKPARPRSPMRHTNQGRWSNKPRPVMCVETGTIYPSISKAGLAIGGPQNICRAIRDNRTAGGYHWCYADPCDVNL